MFLNIVKLYFTYVLQCTGNNKTILYTGYTRDIQKRLKKHRKHEVNTTKKFKSISLIYFEACLNKTDARKREIQLKTGFGRAYLKRRLKSYFFPK